MKIFNSTDMDLFMGEDFTGAHFTLEDYDASTGPHIRLKIQPKSFYNELVIRNKKDRNNFEWRIRSGDLKSCIKTLTAKASVGIKSSRFEEVLTLAHNADNEYQQSLTDDSYESFANNIKSNMRSFDSELLSHPAVVFANSRMETELGRIKYNEERTMISITSNHGSKYIDKNKAMAILDLLDAPKVESANVPKDAYVPIDSPELMEKLKLSVEEYDFFKNYFHSESRYVGSQIKLNGDDYGFWIDGRIRNEVKEYFMPKRSNLMDLI